eukprot:TRINITY_DN2487_c0_g1_i2.p1 TRINITY_DN2487_c0_g1~~TRINITY_DN2487_c0_g1_i2.p1  ORF type:complete len:1366 (-),score=364.25 TRINITY_DN2487_c0_g1_i2:113-4210(-)
MKNLFTLDNKKHGHGPVMFRWHPEATYLATSGPNKVVHIFDRHGELQDQINLNTPGAGQCLDLQWDKDGAILAVLQKGSSVIPLWEASSRKTTNLETDMKDLTLIRWSKHGPQLAVGTAKGNLLIYNKKTRRKIPIIGKHTSAITCGSWNTDNKLALGSPDKQITVSSADGDTLRQVGVKYEPHEIVFAEQKFDEKAAEREQTVSVNMGRKSILLYNISESHASEAPVELQFKNPAYGQILTYQWFGDGYMMVGFTSGYVVVISTHMKEIGRELFGQQFHLNGLTAITFSPALNRAATCGDNIIKVIDLAGGAWKEVSAEQTVLDDAGQVSRMEYSNDGQILTVSTTAGNVYNLLARIPNLTACNGTRLLYLSSLRELAIVDPVHGSISAPLVTVPIDMEPAFLALGPRHVAAGGNNRVWFYRASKKTAPTEVNAVEYIGTVTQIRMNGKFAAVLTGGVVQLHSIEKAANEDEDMRIFPEREDTKDITCLALTEEFLIFGTQRGTVVHYSLADGASTVVNEWRHTTPIKRVYANTGGTRLVVIDENHDGYLYNPAADVATPIDNFDGTTVNVLWDSADWGTFVGISSSNYSTYVYKPVGLSGATAGLAGEDSGRTKAQYGHTPIMVHNGVLICQLPNGRLGPVSLTTHSKLASRESIESDRVSAFEQAVHLNRLKAAWEIGHALPINKNSGLLKDLRKQALEVLDIDMALRISRKLADVGMVFELQKLIHIENKHLLGGHVALLLGDYQTAQTLFLQSPNPVAALDMRRDLLQWDSALQLAKTLAPEEIPFISRQYAQQLEFQGDYSQALSFYEKGLTREPRHHDHDAQCNAGIARVSIRLGDVKRGVNIALESKDKQLCRDCGLILESMKQLTDAAALFEKADMDEKAAAIYIQLKNFVAAAPLMANITTPKLHILFARAKESQGQYKEAAHAYELAGDFDNVVRIYLQHLDNPERVFALVRQTRSVEGAKLVAKFSIKHKDYRAAIEFYLMAKMSEEAFTLATTHNEMEAYAQLLGVEGSQDDYLKIAQHYEDNGQPGKAGEFYAKCGQYHRALRLFLDDGEAFVDQAIEVVGKARNEMMTHTLIDFLMGERDGVPKDPKYIFRLYMMLGNFVQAARTAVIIARQEQDLGNYKPARDLLFETYRELEQVDVAVSADLKAALVLLHSYILARALGKAGNHVAGARMLLRVAKNISKFPMHTVKVLTATVIECQRAGLKKSAFEYGSMLMQPEYRAQVEPAARRKKIEAFVRRPGDVADVAEPSSPCPYCQFQIPETQLDCPSCKNNLPFCIASGKHMTTADWTECPNCKFSALQPEFNTYLQNNDHQCPMCAQQVPSPVGISEPEVIAASLKRYTGRVDKEEKK